MDFLLTGATLVLQVRDPLIGNLILFVPLILIMYFLMLRPQSQARKKAQEMRNALKNGDKVVTSGGIYGIIAGVEGEIVQLRIADQVKVKLERSAVIRVQPETKES